MPNPPAKFVPPVAPVRPAPLVRPNAAVAPDQGLPGQRRMAAKGTLPFLPGVARVVVAGGAAAAIPPGPAANRWQEIAWQPSVAAAVKEAQATGKPLFLFTFVSNGGRQGHPATKDDC
jgi:hypothetical protein